MPKMQSKRFNSVEEALKVEGQAGTLDLINRGFRDREYRSERNADIKATLKWARAELRKRGSDETLRKAK